MLLEGTTRNEIIDYWKAHDVHRMTKLSRRNKHPRRMEVSMHMTITMFHDLFYYGVLAQAGQAVDLRKICPNFKVGSEMVDLRGLDSKNDASLFVFLCNKKWWILEGSNL